MSGFDVILLIGTVFALIGVWQTNKSNAILAEQNRIDREADEANAGNSMGAYQRGYPCAVKHRSA